VVLAGLVAFVTQYVAIMAFAVIVFVIGGHPDGGLERLSVIVSALVWFVAFFAAMEMTHYGEKQ
jgi:hypothetical protein